MTRALVLNASSEPMHICDARRALLMVLDGSAYSVLDSDTIVHSQYESFALPSVVALYRYVNVPHGRSIPLTTRTVVARDGGRCGFCGKQVANTIDHIIPRAQGGKHTWENVIAACYPCNHKKRDRTPEEADMPLLFKPIRPRGAHARLLLYSLDPAWEPWLQRAKAA